MAIDDFSGRTAVITGSASGIGRAMARALADRGANLVLADIEGPALDVVVDEIGAGGAKVVGLTVDVSDPAQIRALAGAANDLFGKIHFLMNNAGVCTTGFAEEQSQAQWDWVMGVNLTSVIHGCRTFLPLMKSHGEPAHIVNTASMAGMEGGPLMAPYFTSKFAVVGLSESLWHEAQVSSSTVDISVLCPGFVETGIARSDRNQPDGLGGWVAAGSEAGSQFAQLLEAGVDGGIDPAEVVERVREAVAEGRLWILTHPAAGDSVLGRADRIVGSGTPKSRDFDH